MKTKEITFIKYHGAFAHEVGETATLEEHVAKNLIDNGYAVAGKGKEKAVATGGEEKAVIELVGEKAVDAVAKQRAEAHGDHLNTVTVGTPTGPAEMPVATEANGNKILVKPEDAALKQADNSPAVDEATGLVLETPIDAESEKDGKSK